jgi:hypothetical protein
MEDQIEFKSKEIELLIQHCQYLEKCRQDDLSAIYQTLTTEEPNDVTVDMCKTLISNLQTKYDQLNEELINHHFILYNKDKEITQLSESVRFQEQTQNDNALEICNLYSNLLTLDQDILELKEQLKQKEMLLTTKQIDINNQNIKMEMLEKSNMEYQTVIQNIKNFIDTQDDNCIFINPTKMLNDMLSIFTCRESPKRYKRHHFVKMNNRS